MLQGGWIKFQAVSGGGEMDHSKGTRWPNDRIGGDGPADFDLSEHALDAITPS